MADAGTAASFAAFAFRSSPAIEPRATSSGLWAPEAFDVTVDIGGVAIAPGDYVIADIDGVVIIPSNIVVEVVEEVEKVMSAENLVRKAIFEGVPPQEAYLRYGKF